MKTDWHMKVYHKNYKKSKLTDGWFKAKAACLKRDKYTCQRCEMRNTQGRGLTAHHITPRADDGGDDLTNLITLCDPCHDYVEVHELRTRAAIIGSYEVEFDMSAEQTEQPTDEGYHFVRPAWHRWVYGGQKKPQ
jgi:5-methylcytosine-specific restriction endonuclease McrA